MFFHTIDVCSLQGLRAPVTNCVTTSCMADAADGCLWPTVPTLDVAQALRSPDVLMLLIDAVPMAALVNCALISSAWRHAVAERLRMYRLIEVAPNDYSFAKPVWSRPSLHGAGYVAVDENANVIYVGDTTNNRLLSVKVELSQRQTRSIVAGDRQHLRLPRGVAMDRAKRMWVASEQALVRLGALGGGPQHIIDKNGGTRPMAVLAEGMAFSDDGSTLYVTLQQPQAPASRLSAHTLLALRPVGPMSDGQPRATDTHGLRWVWEAGGHGTAPGQLAFPAGLCIAAGEVFVCDSDNDRLSVFCATTGRFHRALGHKAATPGCFRDPRDVCVVPRQPSEEGCSPWRLLVAEAGRLQLLTINGSPLQLVAVPGAVALWGLCVDSSHVYVLDERKGELHALKRVSLAKNADVVASNPASAITDVSDVPSADAPPSAVDAGGLSGAGALPSLEAVLRSAKLEHLIAPLVESGGLTAASCIALLDSSESWRATAGRPALLARLKAAGCERLVERQAVANALGKARREAKQGVQGPVRGADSEHADAGGTWTHTRARGSGH